MDDCVLPAAEMLSRLSGPVIFVGDGAVRYRQLIEETLGDNALFAAATQNVPRPSNGAMLAEISFTQHGPLLPEQLLPNYLRLSEAELSRKQKA
jgi:tRNA threonylcarbamoyladenosine biosynthesis protein TsaB